MTDIKNILRKKLLAVVHVAGDFALRIKGVILNKNSKPTTNPYDEEHAEDEIKNDSIPAPILQTTEKNSQPGKLFPAIAWDYKQIQSPAHAEITTAVSNISKKSLGPDKQYLHIIHANTLKIQVTAEILPLTKGTLKLLEILQHQ